MEWFPTKKSIVTGIVASGIAISPVFMNIIQTLFVNPYNLPPASEGFFKNDKIIESVPVLFLVMASVAGVILLIGLLMYQELQRQTIQEERISSELTTIYTTSRQSCCKELSESITKNVDCRTVIKTEELFVSLEEDSNKVNVDDEKSYSYGEVELHVSPRKALKMKEFYFLSVVCICSYYPFIFVNVSYKLTCLLLLGVKTVLLFTLVVTPYGGEVMYMIWICGLFATFSISFVCIPAVVAEIFGTKYAAEIIGMILFTSSACMFLWPLVLHRITSLGWFATFCVTASVSLTGLVVTIFFPESQRT
ncbi:uncharacterized protein LOC143258188 isoform X2 [Tachypleus tridentatus]|uniref:uncharacterized protein LOC143258188 isoform X2 n=1 Tax=Tachypleus tridentatus TaxID=6853 RepID=UPI003FD4CF02